MSFSQWQDRSWIPLPLHPHKKRLTKEALLYKKYRIIAIVLVCLLLSETISTEYRTISSWFKRNGILFTAIWTGYGERLSISAISSSSSFVHALFLRLSASRTPSRCVVKSFFLVEFLLRGCPGKLITTVLASYCLVLECWCHLESPPFFRIHVLSDSLTWGHPESIRGKLSIECLDISSVHTLQCYRCLTPIIAHFLGTQVLLW